MIGRIGGWTAPRTFLVLALAMGGVFAIVNPPYAVNDEDVHLARIYELASGRLITRLEEDSQQYHDVPKEYADLANRYVGFRQKAEGRINVPELLDRLGTWPVQEPLQHFPGRAGTYPPLMYLPHVPAVWVAKVLGLPCLWHLYFARFASLVAYALLAWQAVRVAGPLQWLFVTLGALPMALVQAAGVSGDGLIIGSALLFFALIARYGITGTDAPPVRALGALAALLGFLLITKPVYALAAVSLPLLRWEGARAKWYRWVFPCAIVMASAALYTGWMRMNPQSPPDPKRSPPAQIAWLLAHPFGFVDVMATTALRSGDDLMIQFFAIKTRLAPYMRFLGGIIIVIYAQLLLVLAWGAARGLAKLALTRAWSVALLLLSWFLSCAAVVVALYLTFTRVGHQEVIGLQGRYFIPCAPPLLLGLSLLDRPPLGRWITRRHPRFVIGAICAMNAAALFGIVGWQYFPPSMDWPY